MKKSLLAAGMFGAASMTAHAQSSVTLYGIVDAGITYNSNSHGKSSVSATSGTLSDSRFGLAGSEDLGGGLRAVFTLENGFNVMNGKTSNNSSLFGRQAFVGLSSDRFGTLTLGRQYDSVNDTVGSLQLSSISHPYDNDNLNQSFRINNSVKYQSANFGGLSLTGLYGFSNSTSQGNNGAFSVGGSYRVGALDIEAGYLQLNRPGSSSNTSGAVSDDTTFTARRQRTWGAGLNYAFANATVGAMVTQTRLGGLTGISASASGTDDGLSFGKNSAHFTNYEVQGRYNFTPALSLTGAYTYTDARLDGARPKWNQLDLTADYLLSKHTDVYLQGAYQALHGQGDTNLSASIDGLSASDQDHQATVTIGLRHRF